MFSWVVGTIRATRTAQWISSAWRLKPDARTESARRHGLPDACRAKNPARRRRATTRPGEMPFGVLFGQSGHGRHRGKAEVRSGNQPQQPDVTPKRLLDVVIGQIERDPHCRLLIGNLQRREPVTSASPATSPAIVRCGPSPFCRRWAAGPAAASARPLPLRPQPQVVEAARVFRDRRVTQT